MNPRKRSVLIAQQKKQPKNNFSIMKNFVCIILIGLCSLFVTHNSFADGFDRDVGIEQPFVFELNNYQPIEIVAESFETLEVQYSCSVIPETEYTSAIFSWLVEDPGQSNSNHYLCNSLNFSSAENPGFIQRKIDYGLRLLYSNNWCNNLESTIRML